MLKKLMKMVVALGMVLSMAACSSSKDDNKMVTLKVWGSQEDQAMLGEMIEAFKEAHPEKEYAISLGVVGEPDAKTKYFEDPAAAADVFAFANDQLKDLVAGGALYEVTRNKDAIVAANGAGSVGSATLDDKLYAYPMTADNGYYMYYDKSVFTEEDVKNLDKMMEVAAKAGKKVLMDVSNGWYIASFFLANGGTLTIGEDGLQDCNFNDANGLAVGEYIRNFTAHEAFITGDDAVIAGGMGTTIAAAVSGAWNAPAVQELLGDNYGATKLPTFTLNGEEVQMSSFAGYKLVGVNSQTEFPTDAMDLAEWLTNEENQIKRFNERGAGPSNINAAANEEVMNTPHIAALAEQGQYAISQNDVLGTYWAPAEAFGTACETKDYSSSVQEMLDNMVAQIEAAN
ncbi:MAG: extracellular solute-binding protein [Erysipelotrichales bacterium]|nr:extracellular solute-binding protein [Erysipelotrichales bacterium]